MGKSMANWLKNQFTASRSVSVGGSVTETEVPDRLETTLIELLIQSRKSSPKIPKNFNAILMQFPKIDRALTLVKQEFDAVDADKSNTISKSEMRACLEKLKVHITEEEAEEIYQHSDIDHSGELGFKEFIMALAFIHLTGKHGIQEAGQEDHRLGLPTVEVAFDTIVDAFFFFDKDMDGVLNKLEVQRSFSSSLDISGEGKTLHSSSGRFNEMDYDHNGRCTFKEFLFAFVGWVGTAEEDEDEDEE